MKIFVFSFQLQKTSFTTPTLPYLDKPWQQEIDHHPNEAANHLARDTIARPEGAEKAETASFSTAAPEGTLHGHILVTSIQRMPETNTGVTTEWSNGLHRRITIIGLHLPIMIDLHMIIVHIAMMGTGTITGEKMCVQDPLVDRGIKSRIHTIGVT